MPRAGVGVSSHQYFNALLENIVRLLPGLMVASATSLRLSLPDTCKEICMLPEHAHFVRCPGRESNPHARNEPAPSTLCVYQFHHLGLVTLNHLRRVTLGCLRLLPALQKFQPPLDSHLHYPRQSLQIPPPAALLPPHSLHFPLPGRPLRHPQPWW